MPSAQVSSSIFANVMVRPEVGGKPFIQPSASGSVSAVVAGCWLGAVETDMKAGSGSGDAEVVSWGRMMDIQRLCRGDRRHARGQCPRRDQALSIIDGASSEAYICLN